MPIKFKISNQNESNLRLHTASSGQFTLPSLIQPSEEIQHYLRCLINFDEEEQPIDKAIRDFLLQIDSFIDKVKKALQRYSQPSPALIYNHRASLVELADKICKYLLRHGKESGRLIKPVIECLRSIAPKIAKLLGNKVTGEELSSESPAVSLQSFWDRFTGIDAMFDVGYNLDFWADGSTASPEAGHTTKRAYYPTTHPPLLSPDARLMIRKISALAEKYPNLFCRLIQCDGYCKLQWWADEPSDELEKLLQETYETPKTFIKEQVENGVLKHIYRVQNGFCWCDSDAEDVLFHNIPFANAYDPEVKVASVLVAPSEPLGIYWKLYGFHTRGNKTNSVNETVSVEAAKKLVRDGGGSKEEKDEIILYMERLYSVQLKPIGLVGDDWLYGDVYGLYLADHISGVTQPKSYPEAMQLVWPGSNDDIIQKLKQHHYDQARLNSPTTLKEFIPGLLCGDERGFHCLNNTNGAWELVSYTYARYLVDRQSNGFAREIIQKMEELYSEQVRLNSLCGKFQEFVPGWLKGDERGFYCFNNTNGDWQSVSYNDAIDLVACRENRNAEDISEKIKKFKSEQDVGLNREFNVEILQDPNWIWKIWFPFSYKNWIFTYLNAARGHYCEVQDLSKPGSTWLDFALWEPMQLGDFLDNLDKLAETERIAWNEKIKSGECTKAKDIIVVEILPESPHEMKKMKALRLMGVDVFAAQRATEQAASPQDFTPNGQRKDKKSKKKETWQWQEAEDREEAPKLKIILDVGKKQIEELPGCD